MSNSDKSNNNGGPEANHMKPVPALLDRDYLKCRSMDKIVTKLGQGGKKSKNNDV